MSRSFSAMIASAMAWSIQACARQRVGQRCRMNQIGQMPEDPADMLARWPIFLPPSRHACNLEVDDAGTHAFRASLARDDHALHRRRSQPLAARLPDPWGRQGCENQITTARRI